MPGEKKQDTTAAVNQRTVPEREMTAAQGKIVSYRTGSLKTKDLCLIYSAVSVPRLQWLLIIVK